MMTLEEMKLAVCEKLPEIVCINPTNKMIHWQLNEPLKIWHEEVRWPTEGLQVCHEAEKLLTQEQKVKYLNTSRDILVDFQRVSDFTLMHATYEQRLEALCRVWFPERFTT